MRGEERKKRKEKKIDRARGKEKSEKEGRGKLKAAPHWVE